MIMFHNFQLFAKDIASKDWSEVDGVDDLLIATVMSTDSVIKAIPAGLKYMLSAPSF